MVAFGFEFLSGFVLSKSRFVHSVLCSWFIEISFTGPLFPRAAELENIRPEKGIADALPSTHLLHVFFCRLAQHLTGIPTSTSATTTTAGEHSLGSLRDRGVEDGSFCCVILLY